MVLGNAWSAAWERSGMKNTILILLGILATIAFFGICQIFGLITLQDANGNSISAGFSGFATICFSGVLLILFFVVLSFTTPVNIYEKQGGFIENPFDITPVDPSLNSSNPERSFVNIKVSNKSALSNIEECFLELTGITSVGFSHKKNIEPQRLRWGHRETDAGESRDHPITIYYDSPRWCDVAVLIHAKNVVVPMTSYGEPISLEPGVSNLTVKVNGKWKNTPIHYVYTIVLKYEPPTVLKIEDVVPVEKTP